MTVTQKLKRLAEHKAANLKAELNKIEQQISSLHGEKQKLEQQLDQETKLAMQNPALALNLQTFAKGVRIKIFAFDTQIQDLLEQQSQLQEKILQEFAEIKKMDIYENRIALEEKRKQQRAEQLQIDELNINKKLQEH